jgi:hypothetical protein
MSSFPDETPQNDPLTSRGPAPEPAAAAPVPENGTLHDEPIYTEAANAASLQAEPVQAAPVRAEPFRAECGLPAIGAATPALAPEENLGDRSPLLHSPVDTEPERPLFVGAMMPEVRRPMRIPHLGHLLILLLILCFAFAGTIGLMALAVHYHVYGVTSLAGTAKEIHYTLGSELLIYLLALVGSLVIFPLFWDRSLFEGLQWNFGTAKRLAGRLVGIAVVCFAAALLNSVLIPGPKHAPIEDVFREPGAAWLLFVFGVTCAPFFEEMFFRGFLLPSLATACDWIAEKLRNECPLPFAPGGHPRWSMPAMIIASILTSIPFAGLHAAQTGYSVGPFLLLVTVSLVLCAVRLWTRSLAASTLVHASYNFMLFSFMIIGTQGFRHMDKL